MGSHCKTIMITSIFTKLSLILSLVSFPSHVSSQEVSIAANETSNEIDLDQLEYLCHHYYPEEFVVSAEVLESGCRLECVLLKSSGDHGSNFFDASVTKVHNLNEGLSCDTELVSNNYLCFYFSSHSLPFRINNHAPIFSVKRGLIHIVCTC